MELRCFHHFQQQHYYRHHARYVLHSDGNCFALSPDLKASHRLVRALLLWCGLDKDMSSVDLALFKSHPFCFLILDILLPSGVGY